MGNFVKKLFFKWWIWPLPLIALQVIQSFLIRKSFVVVSDGIKSFVVVSDGIPGFLNFQDNITKISIILLIANVCLWIYYIIRRQRRAILGHLAMMGVASFLFFGNIIGIGVWWMFNSDLVDDFGKKHPIPENVDYCEPLSSFKSDRVDEYGNRMTADISYMFNPDDSTTWLQVSKGFQGGMYNYSFYISQEFDEGEIWLECYEVTDNIQLSKKRITESTIQKITAEDQGKYTEPKEFTIYEGVWDEFYLARFEVWYIDYATRTKRKLTEKTYKVDGWVR